MIRKTWRGCRSITYLLTYLLHGAESFWEANWFAVSQEITRISRNSKVHCRTYKCPRTVYILGQHNKYIFPHPTPWRSILILSIHLSLGLHSGLFPSGFPSKTIYNPLFSPIRATYPAHIMLLDFIASIILGEQYKSFSSSLCNLLQSLVTSSLLGPNILLNTMFSNTLSLLIITHWNCLWNFRPMFFLQQLLAGQMEFQLFESRVLSYKNITLSVPRTEENIGSVPS